MALKGQEGRDLGSVEGVLEVPDLVEGNRWGAMGTDRRRGDVAEPGFGLLD